MENVRKDVHDGWWKYPFAMGELADEPVKMWMIPFNDERTDDDE